MDLRLTDSLLRVLRDLWTLGLRVGVIDTCLLFTNPGFYDLYSEVDLCALEVLGTLAPYFILL